MFLQDVAVQYLKNQKGLLPQVKKESLKQDLTAADQATYQRR